MHSSRMRTGRSLTVWRGGGSPCWGVSLAGVSLLGGRSPCQGGSPCWGGSRQGVVSLPGGWGVSLPGGLLARGVSLPGGVLLARGVSLPGGSPCQGGFPAGGLPARGVSLPGASLAGGSHCWGDLPARGFSLPETPPVDRITDTSKNISLATTSLWPVKI